MLLLLHLRSLQSEAVHCALMPGDMTCDAIRADTPLCLTPCQALEFQAQQSLWALQQEEMAAAGTSALQDAAAAQAAALAAEQQRKNAEWQAEDEVRVLRQQHETARRARLVAAAEQEAAKQAAKGLLLTQELQAQEELLKVQHHGYTHAS